MTSTSEDTKTTPLSSGHLQHVDPASLIVGDNVRTEAALDRDFLASITTHGVLTPITAVYDAAGQLMVRDGQRRTRAAQQVGLATCPVYVLPSEVATFTEFEVERLVQQITLNDRRLDLTDAQRVHGIQQILHTGVSVTKAAKLLAAPKSTVQHAATAAKSTAAMDALAAGQIGLDEAVIIAEFDQDDEAVTALLNAVGTGKFEHVVERLRGDRELDAAYAEAEAHYQAKGIPVIDARPHWSDLACLSLRHLRTADGAEITEVTEDMRTVPYWAVELVEVEAYFDTESGELVDEDLIDFTTRWNKDAEPEDGLVHFATVEQRTVIDADWYCTDYQACGLTLSPAMTRTAERVSSPDGDKSANAALDAETRADIERRERRKTLALNRLGDAAITVRRKWITALLTRKTPPKGAALFVARALVCDPALISDYRAIELAAQLLGMTSTAALEKHLKGLGTAADNRAQVITLALVLAALENRTPKDGWRTTGGWRGAMGSKQYLSFLQANSYTPAEIEAVMLGTKTADEVYRATEDPKAGTSSGQQ